MSTTFLVLITVFFFAGGLAIFLRGDDVRNAPEPEVEKVPEKVPDISEPVISFVRIVKENPRRFKCVRETKPEMRGTRVVFKDKEEGKIWVVHRTCYPYSLRDCYLYYGFPAWMTEEEQEYVWEELAKVYTSDRRDRLHHLQRERMKRIYN